MKKILLILCLLSSSLLFAQNNKPVPVIFDTDMGPDYDDVGAITLLHAFADSGQAKILATMASTKYEGVAAVINVLNTYFKRPDIPIGVPKGNASELRDFQHWTDTLIAKYPHAVKHNSDASDAVELYRKILSQQPDTSVTIITTGFFTNIAALLQSSPDNYSNLTGKELVNKKVKQLVSMAGRFPSGAEFNVRIDAAASMYTFANWERPVILSGFEIGVKIKSGLPLINNNSIQNSPVKDVFRISIPLAPDDNLGRCSWDQTAVLVGVLGYKPYYKLRPGTMIVYDDGKNSWDNNGNKQFYLAEDRSPSEVQDVINKLMQHRP
jgi:inosine-uridine nucleoside N-ribohydrolase